MRGAVAKCEAREGGNVVPRLYSICNLDSFSSAAFESLLHL